MISPPDPRIYAAAGDDSLARLAARAGNAGSALQQNEAGQALLAALGAELERGEDREIRRALDRPLAPAARRALERGIEIAAAPPVEAAVAFHAFAFPVVFVAGGTGAGKIPGTVPDMHRLRELLALHGALGQNRNVGLGNALAGEAALAAIGPAMLYQLGRGGEDAMGRLQLAPEAIAVDTADEQAYLRFIVGAALAPRDAPVIPETAANVGAWGMSWTRELTEQLAQPGLSLLAVPRPPLPIPRALAAGRFACREIGFQLFLSRALRDFRSRVGEPSVRVASFADATVRVALTTPFDTSLVCEYRWPLERGDDFDAVATSILELLRECRVEGVEVVPAVQPAGASH